MFKLFIPAALLLLTSFTSSKPLYKYKEIAFCEGVQQVIKTMKSGEEQTMKGWEMEAENTNESKVDIAGWSESITDKFSGFSFIAESEDVMDMAELQTKFADIRAELIECMKLDRKKATKDEPEYFTIANGSLKIGLSISNSIITDYCLRLSIFKPKR